MSQRVDTGIPELLDINKFEKSYLDDTGEFVVARYSGTSSVVIGNVKSKSSNVIKSALCTDINHLAICCPLLFTLTDNFIQVINITSYTFEQIFQDSFFNEDIKYILTNSKYLVGVGIKRLIVWKREALQEPPKVIKMTPLQDALGCGQIGSISQSTSFIDSTRIIVINRNPVACLFQIWDIEESSLVCWARHPLKAEGKATTETFSSFKTCAKSGAIVGASKGNLYIWDTNNRVENDGEKELLLCDPHYVLFEDSIITAIHVDKSFIITGDNNGCITMLTAAGKEIYPLKTTSQNSSSSDTISLFKNKIVEISRAGRWVVASDNSGHVYLCDIFTPEQIAPPDFSAPSNGTIKGFRISNGKITVLSHPNKESRSSFKVFKNRPDVSLWTPPQIKDSLLRSGLDSQEHWEDSPIELLSSTLTKTCTSEVASSLPLSRYVERFRTITKFLNEVSEKEAETGKNVPFLLIQHAQQMLDELEELILLSEKPGKSKHKEGIPLAAKSFFRAVVIMSEILSAPESPLKVRDYFTASDSLSSECESAEKKKEDEAKEDEEVECKKFPEAKQKEPSQRTLRRWSKSEIKLQPGIFLSKSGLHVRQRAIKDTPKESDEKKEDSDALTQSPANVNNMLEELDRTFSDMHTKVNDAIGGFDVACGEGTFDKEKGSQLLGVYSSLLQFDEDFKEMGKDIAALRDTEAAESSAPWYENGGCYDDEITDSSLAAYSGLSVDSEGSSSTVSTN